MFRTSRPNDREAHSGEQDQTPEFMAASHHSTTQALLELLLDHAYLEDSPEDGGGKLIISLQSWQIEVLSTFGIVPKKRSADPGSTSLLRLVTK